MIVFDVDGTLVGGESKDWASFATAFQEAAGFVLDDKFLEGGEEMTAQAIVHQALGNSSAEKKNRMVQAVRENFVRHLKTAHESDSSSFPALEGAVALLNDLKKKKVPVAIATGDWVESSTFKLRAAGIPFEEIPLVTASDFYGRAEIIAAAVAKAGRPLHEAVYVADGLWDFRASKKLGIPFIGVGRQVNRLRAAGAIYTLQDLNPLGFWRVIEVIRESHQSF